MAASRAIAKQYPRLYRKADKIETGYADTQVRALHLTGLRLSRDHAAWWPGLSAVGG